METHENSVLAEAIAMASQRIGQETHTDLGEISRHQIARFAITVGLTDPIHFDPDYARRLGHGDVVAPPTMLPSIRVWEPGPPESALRPDGTVADNVTPLPGLRRMGGGQKLNLVSPVEAGDRITMSRQLTEAYVKESRSGSLGFLVTEIRYTNQDRQTRIVATETMMIR